MGEVEGRGGGRGNGREGGKMVVGKEEREWWFRLEVASFCICGLEIGGWMKITRRYKVKNIRYEILIL